MRVLALVVDARVSQRQRLLVGQLVGQKLFEVSRYPFTRWSGVCLGEIEETQLPAVTMSVPSFGDRLRGLDVFGAFFIEALHDVPGFCLAWF